MRVKMLRQRASAESIDPDLIDDALDSDTPKETLIQLILQHCLAAAASESSDQRARLGAMRLRALVHLAQQTDGIREEQIIDAEESGAPKIALVELLLGAQKGSGGAVGS